MSEEERAKLPTPPGTQIAMLLLELGFGRPGNDRAGRVSADATLARLLLQLGLGRPAQTTLEQLVRNRAIQTRISQLIIEAAEEKWPGIGQLAGALAEQEKILTADLEPRA